MFFFKKILFVPNQNLEGINVFINSSKHEEKRNIQRDLYVIKLTKIQHDWYKIRETKNLSFFS